MLIYFVSCALHIVEYLISVLEVFKTVSKCKACLSMFQFLGAKAPLGSLEVKVKVKVRVKVKVKLPKTCTIVKKC